MFRLLCFSVPGSFPLPVPQLFTVAAPAAAAAVAVTVAAGFVGLPQGADRQSSHGRQYQQYDAAAYKLVHSAHLSSAQQPRRSGGSPHPRPDSLCGTVSK